MSSSALLTDQRGPTYWYSENSLTGWLRYVVIHEGKYYGIAHSVESAERMIDELKKGK